MIKFYDTCSLLLAGESLFLDEEALFVVSSITFQELEDIKTSTRKDSDVKYSARLLLRLFEQYPDKFEVVIHKEAYEAVLGVMDISVTNDSKILSDAIFYNNSIAPVEFVTNDLCLKHIAQLFLNNVTSIPEETDNYTGFKEVILSDDELARFYAVGADYNTFHLLTNEYLIVKDKDENIVDVRC